MYNLTLINLSADARTAAINEGGNIELKGVSAEDLRALLETFCAIDAVQNVTADPEIRIKTRHENYLVRTGQGKLFLYDVLNREAPAQVLTPEQTVAELDGSAMAERTVAPFMMPGMAAYAAREPEPIAAPRDALNLPRVIVMAVIALGLGGAIFYLQEPIFSRAEPALFKPSEAAELSALRASLAGVYMTGIAAGHHGIVLSTTGELKLFEMNARAAPGVVYASARVGRSGDKLILATNQPGGLIEVSGDGALLYCGEIYRRIP